MIVPAVTILVLGVLTGCQGTVFKMGGCPKVTVLDEMDFDKFLGEWYVVQRFNPMATCTKVKFENVSDSYIVTETSRPLGFYFGNSLPYVWSKKIKFLRNDTQSIFRVERHFANLKLTTFGIVETDYDNFAIVWGCDPILFGSVQNVDILSRTATLDKDVLKNSKQILEDMNIDINSLDRVSRGQCVEASESEEAVTTDGNKDTNNMVIAGQQ